MPIDTSIYGQLRPIQIDSPLEAQAKVDQFRAGQMQNRLAELAFGERQQASQRQNKLASLAGGWGSDTTDDQRISSLRNGGFFTEADSLEGSMLKRRESQQKLDSGDFELAQKRFDIYRKTAGSLHNVPNVSRQMVEQEVTNLASAGVLSPAFAQQITASLPDDPTQLRQVLRTAVTSQLTPEQMLTVFAPKVDKTDTGSAIKFIDTNPNSPTFGKEIAASQTKTMTPGEKAADARGREANDISRQRLAHDKSKPESQVAPATQKVNDANDVLSILDQAEPLLDGATGSYLGVGADLASQAFGHSTEGAKKAAQLKVLQGSLVSKMPKMSGPQSDKDVQLYREMAGQIGDPTVPAELKRAAIKTIRTINRKYAGLPPEPEMPGAPTGASGEQTSNGGWSIKPVP